MDKPLVFVSRLLPDPVMAAIEERFHLTRPPQEDPPSRSVVLEGVREAEGMICTLTEGIDQEVLHAATRLRVIANYAVGFNNIDIDQARARGVVVTNTPDVLTETTADLTWTLLLATARRLAEGHQMVQSGNWKGWSPNQLLGAEVHGKTLGILGMGRIGHAVARRATGFAMPVRYYSRTPLSPSQDSEGWHPVSFESLLAESDFISLHVPLTAETIHLIGRRELQCVKPTAILINTSRGSVVDEMALVEALRNGQLAGAGLDVYEHEPRVDPGLAGLPHVVMLPHLGSATLATRTKMGLMCVENILAVFEGRRAPNAVA